MKNVVVIGAAGHVGLPFTLMLASHDQEINVVGLDLNQEAVDKLNNGHVPFFEDMAQVYLDEYQPRFTTSETCLDSAEYIAVMIGTPVDEEGNPRIDDIVRLMQYTIAPQIVSRNGIVVMLRSTVSPGTTEMLRDKLEYWTQKNEGVDFYLTFCPERVAQGQGINEGFMFPQLIGAFSTPSYLAACNLFDGIAPVSAQLKPIEAELGKLMTNMYRYVNFALANEFMMIAESHGANTKKIFEAVNKNYPRVNLPMPGPNVGGPCLFKDGKFLLDGIPYPELIRSAFDINEGMPDYIWQQIKNIRHGNIRNALIIGAAFKGGNDDTRNSLSFKMKKVLEKHGVTVTMFDPFVEGLTDYPRDRYEAVIVMTPHKVLKDWLKTEINTLHSLAIIVDIWKLFPESENFTNGIYLLDDYRYLYSKRQSKYAAQGE